MATTKKIPSANEHPWLEQFVTDPVGELDRLLSGKALIAPYDMASAPDAARLLFGRLPGNHTARRALEAALTEWLSEHRISGVPALDRLALERWVRTISDAFEIVGLMKLERCALDLRRRFDLWYSWVDRLAVSPQRDARLAFLRTLALTQRAVAEGGEDVAPFGLEPLWLRICAYAGTSFPEEYLDIALLGLRTLPERDKASSERPWMTGLAHWAAFRKPSVEAFSQHWETLKALYPRMPKYWRDRVSDTLNQKQLIAEWNVPQEIAAYWKADVGVAEVQPGTVKKLPTRNLQPASLATVKKLRSRASDPFTTFKGEVKNLIGNSEQYAIVTGDSYFLVTTACNLGMEIIRNCTDDPIGRGRFATDLARTALSWAPNNLYAWSLWRDSLVTQGAFEAAEKIGWKAIFHYPEDVQWRNQLAELLIALDRPDEAKGIVEEIFARELEDAASFDLKARLKFHFEGQDAARGAILSGIEKFNSDTILKHHLRALANNKELPLVSAYYRTMLESMQGLVAEQVDISGGIKRVSSIRKIYSQYRQLTNEAHLSDQAVAEIERVFSEDPNFAYAEYLRNAIGIHGDESKTGSPAVAFIGALEAKDPEKIAALTAVMPGQSQFLDIAKMFLFSEQAAAERSFSWFSQTGAGEPRSVAALRRFLAIRVGGSPLADSAEFMARVATNDNLRIDLIEAVLTAPPMLVAA